MQAIKHEGLSLSLLPSVYSPAEDSFLLSGIAASLRGKILEIGCGSGIVSLTAAKASGKNDVTGIDINEQAVKCAQENAKANGIENCKFFASDLFSKVPSGKFDFILFNPPYLPTAKEEKLKDEKENAAYDGGADGANITRKFLAAAPKYLADGGSIYLIVTSLADQDKKIMQMMQKKGFSVREIASDKFFFEKISVLEIRKADKQ